MKAAPAILGEGDAATLLRGALASAGSRLQRLRAAFAQLAGCGQRPNSAPGPSRPAASCAAEAGDQETCERASQNSASAAKVDAGGPRLLAPVPVDRR